MTVIIRIFIHIDVDECSGYQNDCSYKDGCQNTNGSFVCTCLPGHYLDADMRTCIGSIMLIIN